MRLRGRLDFLLDRNLRRGTESVSSGVLDALRLGAYQLLYMGGVPAHAAVSQAVEQARGLAGPGAGSLTNAVLRALQRENGSERRFPDATDDLPGYLASWGSHPRWLVDRWLACWPQEDGKRLVDHDNRPPDLYVRPLGIPESEAVDRLRSNGVRCRPLGPGTGCILLEDAGASPSLVLSLVPGIIQDPGSALVTAYAAFPAEGRLVDLCAAPGGKALALAGRVSYVVAADRSGTRLALVRDNLRRLGWRMDLVQARAQEPPFLFAESVLLDVPCSGTGTLRRHPDARWRLGPADTEKLAGVQRSLLEGAAGIVRPSGILVYSTCTLEPEENEDQIDAFLARHGEFRLEPAESAAGEFVDRTGYLRVLPQKTGFDGAFAARLRRVR
jgi:16S rRNA (cytosine967-C5)-methyltransferase